MAWVSGNSVVLIKRKAGSPGGWSVFVCLTVLWCALTAARGQFGQLVAFESPGNTTYYVDAETGDDENPGTRAESAWRTLGRVNSTRFAPGDSILIKAGTTYEDKLWPKGTGVPGNPVTIGSYGEGPRPNINTHGEASATLLLENTNAWHVRDLELTNTGEKPEAFRYGVSILIEDRGEVGDFELKNLYVHGVNGAAGPGLGAGAGIIWRNRGAAAPSRFNGLLIEGCVVKDCGRNGIAVESGHTQRDRRLANVNVVLRENEVEGVGGSGILLTGCDNAVVEYNRIHGVGKARMGESGGIDLSGCDNAVVQYNQVGGGVGRDSAAFRIGPNSLENTVQFNFSHDNTGAMAAVVGGEPDDGRGLDAGNRRTVVRYNISQNDKAAFRVAGPVAEARLYNNTVYTSEEIGPSVILRLDPRPASASGVEIANNLFYCLGTAAAVEQEAVLELEQATSEDQPPPWRFHHNAYFGGETAPPAGQKPADAPEPITADPLLVDPGKGVSIDDGLEGYQLQPESPLRGAGVRMSGHGRYDFGSNPVPAGTAVDIGAFQMPSDNPP